MIRLCERAGCHDSADDWHHKLSRTKANLKKIGKYLIDHPLNGIYLCRRHHINLLSAEKWSEREFYGKMELMKCEYCVKEERCNHVEYNIKDWALECRGFEFDADFYYEYNDIDRNKSVPGSYKYKG